MAYQVFARKWRPQNFDDVVGQEHITGTLCRAIESNRVAHAFIFAGTRGVGKTTTARILARALNCEQGPTASPCGVCTNCKSILGGSSFDVLEIDGASNNSVEDIRELRENIGYSSMGGKYRIFVIDEVHMLSKSAFNALLKTLEEPPANVIFIFATTEPHKIPATIHSRCQRYDFRRIGAEQILQRLIHICESEEISYERGALMLVARKADGSMRDSLSLLDQVYSFCAEGITENEVRSVLGIVGVEVYREIVDSIREKDPVPSIKAVKNVLYNGYDLHDFILGFQDHVRNLLFARIPGALEARGAELEKDVIEMFAEDSKLFAETDLLRMAEILKKTEAELRWSAFPRFLVEVMVLKLVYLDSTVSIEQLLKMAGKESPEPQESSSVSDQTSSETDSKKKNSLDSAGVSYTQNVEDSGNKTSLVKEVSGAELYKSDGSAENFIDTKVVVPQDLKENWPAFIDHLIHERPNLGAFMAQGRVLSVNDTTVDIQFGAECGFQYREINRKQNRDLITQILHRYTGAPVALRVTLEQRKKEAKVEPYAPEPVEKSGANLDEEIEKEPIIKTLLDLVDGEIIS
ncbi:DNA polymerase III subunits gamma and tau [Chitinispirillum alkaliphilum]|nr:DNA polymerase III subunits gamma and tau [Chitinispirillum alkaliphilum]